MTEEQIVPWELDPRQRAKKIKCAVCNVCEWHPNSNMCAFGGPYLGYIERKPEPKPEPTINEH